MGEDKLAVEGVQGEAVNAVADRQDHDYGARVHAVAGGQEVAPWLAHIHDAVLGDLINLQM